MSEPHASKSKTNGTAFKNSIMEEPPEEEGIYQWQRHDQVPKGLKKYFFV
jgi:hypothetical protein